MKEFLKAIGMILLCLCAVTAIMTVLKRFVTKSYLTVEE